MRGLDIGVSLNGRANWLAMLPYSDMARLTVGLFSEWTRLTRKEPELLRRVAMDYPEILREITGFARLICADPHDTLAANVFYDAASRGCACTCFAIDTDQGPIHAHCLDWDYGVDSLRSSSVHCRFRGPTGETLWQSTGWPGFLGAFVGVAPRRFTVTLNAVWSEDEPDSGEPVAFLIRRALATSSSFGEAVSLLAGASIACDCLLVVTGVLNGEIALIERTPTTTAVRLAQDSPLVVTNHYQVLQRGLSRPGYLATGEEPTGRGTFERHSAATCVVTAAGARTPEEWLLLLAEPPFHHSINIQRAVMRASDGVMLAEAAPVAE